MSGQHAGDQEEEQAAAGDEQPSVPGCMSDAGRPHGDKASVRERPDHDGP